jgi:hypothetical protein
LASGTSVLIYKNILAEKILQMHASLCKNYRNIGFQENYYHEVSEKQGWDQLRNFSLFPNMLFLVYIGM